MQPLVGAKTPHKHENPAKHDFWYPPYIVPLTQNVRSFCLCGLLGTELGKGADLDERVLAERNGVDETWMLEDAVVFFLRVFSFEGLLPRALGGSKKGSALGLYNLHQRSIRVRNGGFYCWILPGLRAEGTPMPLPYRTHIWSERTSYIPR